MEKEFHAGQLTTILDALRFRERELLEARSGAAPFGEADQVHLDDIRDLITVVRKELCLGPVDAACVEWCAEQGLNPSTIDSRCIDGFYAGWAAAMKTSDQE